MTKQAIYFATVGRKSYAVVADTETEARALVRAKHPVGVMVIYLGFGGV